MKTLFSTAKLLFCSLLVVMSLCLSGCTSVGNDPLCETADAEAAEEDASSSVMFTILLADGATREETYEMAYESEHAAAYVQAHAIDEDTARGLLDCFENIIRPGLPVPSSLKKNKLNVLISYMEGTVYGYTPFPIMEQGPIACLNALYDKDLAYGLAHEYQHLCSHDACETGRTSLSEETDELLSDVFCELLFPGYGQRRGILSKERASAAQERIDRWGQNGMLNVYVLLREGYSENELLLAME